MTTSSSSLCPDPLEALLPIDDSGLIAYLPSSTCHHHKSGLEIILSWANWSRGGGSPQSSHDACAWCMQRVVSDPSYHLYSSCPPSSVCLKVQIAFLGFDTYLAVPPGAHAGGAMPLLLRLTVPVGVPVRMVAGHAVMVVPEDGQTRQVHHLGPDTHAKWVDATRKWIRSVSRGRRWVSSHNHQVTHSAGLWQSIVHILNR